MKKKLKQLIEWLWWQTVNTDDKYDLLKARFERLRLKNNPEPEYLKQPKKSSPH